jgi:acetyl-CoA carboxylase carboxyltransferase component
MQGRKNYTKEEIEQGRTAISQQLAAYQELAVAADSVAGETTTKSAQEPFEALFFNNMTLVLDRYFVHRLAGADYEGKDGNPLNEVRIVADSLITNNGIMRGDKQIKLAPERSVLGLNVGDRIKLTGEQFERLSAAFFNELEHRFL